jgi:hypothetical protein
MLAAAVVVTLLGAMAETASAAIRITIGDGVPANERVFYFASSPTSMPVTTVIPGTSVGPYDFIVHSSLSNHPGSGTGASLTQTLIVSDFFPGPGLVLPTLTVTAAVIQDVAGAPAGEVTGTPFLGAVNSASLLLFTIPAGPTLRVTSDIGSTGPTGGTVQNITTVNGVAVPSLAIPINSVTDAEQTAVVANGPSGYTLTSQIVLSGVGAESVGVGITASSTAALTPEPGSLAIWSLGAIGLLVAVGRRRRFPSPTSSGLAA